MLRRAFALLIIVLAAAGAPGAPAAAQENQADAGSAGESRHAVELGDTWRALAWRFDLPLASLYELAGAINPQRQPAVSSDLALPSETSLNGRFLRPYSGGMLELSARNHLNPWTLAARNKLDHPYRPLLYTPLVIPGGTLPPHELPAGLEFLALSPGPIVPGAVFALRARLLPGTEVSINLEREPLLVSVQEHSLVAIGATGAFFAPGTYTLSVRAADGPLWEQPLVIADRGWTWDQVTFTNTAVLDAEEIRLERERLQTIWDEVTPEALWQGQFELPIEEYVAVSSQYGARRSVNGGPYNTYHEGTDFSAFGGSPVRAPAAGRVVLSEPLAIRGGAVILDHGLGLHSGYYHLSKLHVFVGQKVEPGDLLGEVGSTGRSTGNHLHWDLLAGRIWTDPLSWLDQGIDGWLSDPAGPDSSWQNLAQ